MHYEDFLLLFGGAKSHDTDDRLEVHVISSLAAQILEVQKLTWCVSKESAGIATPKKVLIKEPLI